MPRQDYYLPERRLVNQQDTALVATPRIPRSRIKVTWTRTTAFDAGKLYPIMIDEILPGDHVSYDVSAYVRMSTPLFPLFSNQRVDTHFFFVPCRLVWANWERMLGSQDDPTDTIAYTVPKVPYVGNVDGIVGSLYDHMGLPTEGQIDTECIGVNAMPFRAYNLIWNQWFRDQNLQTSLDVPTGDGPDDPDAYHVKRRNKFHDYFTSALPWPQKFDAPTLFAAGLAPVIGIGYQAAGADVPGENWLETTGVRNFAHAQAFDDVTAPVTPRLGVETLADATPQIFADLSAATGVTMTEFRQAALIQELLERDARGGTRYTEILKNHFGVTSPDARLQRPEYIGGGRSPLNVTPIAQTAPTAAAPLGALGAAGSAAGSHRASYAATEHGYIIGLLSVRTELAYQQGVHRMWTRNTRYDFPWPSLAGLSEQAILTGEIWATGDSADDAVIWGYQERYQEFRTKLSEITGIMRSTETGTLDAWHLAEKFGPTTPLLNGEFVAEDPPMSRVLAASSLADGQQYLANIMFNRTMVRSLPTYGIPASLTRF